MKHLKNTNKAGYTASTMPDPMTVRFMARARMTITGLRALRKVRTLSVSIGKGTARDVSRGLTGIRVNLMTTTNAKCGDLKSWSERCRRSAGGSWRATVCFDDLEKWLQPTRTTVSQPGDNGVFLQALIQTISTVEFQPVNILCHGRSRRH